MININRVIAILIGADVFFQIGTGFVDPIFAVFLVESLSGGSIQLAGTAVAIYWLVKSILRLPLAYFLDKKRGENDDFYVMLLGFFLMTVSQFLYLFAKTPVHIYIIQIILGVGGAFAFTPWYGFFSRHIDKHQENMEWSISNSTVGFAIAGAGFAAGIVADNYGFAPIFVISGILSLMGTFMLILIGKSIKLKKNDGYTLRRIKKAA